LRDLGFRARAEASIFATVLVEESLVAAVKNLAHGQCVVAVGRKLFGKCQYIF